MPRTLACEGLQNGTYIMKILKFQPELCAQILSAKSTATWRLFDD